MADIVIGPPGSILDWDNWGKPMTDAVNDATDRLDSAAETRDAVIATTTTVLASATYAAETVIANFNVNDQLVFAGAAYLFLGQCFYVPTALSCEWQLRLRENNISGTIIGTTRLPAVPNAGFGYPSHWYFNWACTADDPSKDFVYTIFRNAGAGNVSILGTDGGGPCTHMSLLRMGSSAHIRNI